MDQSAPIAERIVLLSDQESLEKKDFINLVKGFSRVFWGLALTAVLLLSQTKLELFSVFSVPACLLGTMIHFWGLLTLWRAGKVSPLWKGRLLFAIVLVLLEIYFFPFVRWWKMMPYVSFFMFNVGALVAAVILSLYLSNMIAADFFRSLSLKAEKLEAQVYAGAVMGFMAVPFFIAVVFSVVSAARYQTAFVDELIEAARHGPIWLYVIVTIPCSLTLAVLWKARDRSYHQFCREKEIIK